MIIITWLWFLYLNVIGRYYRVSVQNIFRTVKGKSDLGRGGTLKLLLPVLQLQCVLFRPLISIQNRCWNCVQKNINRCKIEKWKGRWKLRHVRYPLFSILMKLEFSRQIFEESSRIKFNQNHSSGSRVVLCGQTDGHEANSRFSQFCEKRLRTPFFLILTTQRTRILYRNVVKISTSPLEMKLTGYRTYLSILSWPIPVVLCNCIYSEKRAKNWINSKTVQCPGSTLQKCAVFLGGQLIGFINFIHF